MPIEVEKKFLVKLEVLAAEIELEKLEFKMLKQAYLASSSTAVVRVRRDEHKAYLTVKQRASSLKRIEVEREISIAEAEELFELCPSSLIEKRRYYIPFNELTIELDVFLGANEGLVLAEVEFADEEQSQAFTPPSWFSDEVSADHRYYNHYLSEHPYSNSKA
jgi:adenylate cyclase